MSDKIVMPRGLRNKWLAALRSGEYKQGQGYLYDAETKGFCCLGVLSHCALKGNVEIVGEDCIRAGLDSGTFEEAPSKAFYDAFRITMPDSLEYDLITMNDEYNAPFSEIADYIEQNSRGR